jgi:hypothetical protein
MGEEGSAGAAALQTIATDAGRCLHDAEDADAGAQITVMRTRAVA